MLQKYQALVNKNSSRNQSVENYLPKPSYDELVKTTERTSKALNSSSGTKVKSISMRPSEVKSTVELKPTYIRYTPNNQYTSAPNHLDQRIVRISELPKDPMEPVKFKHRRMQREISEPAVPIMHSPPRKVTAQDQLDWKVPPCISNYKNAKGYTIPLEMRVSADMRNMRDIEINDKFSKFADVLYLAEKKARAEIEENNRIKGAIHIANTLKKEQELKEAAKDIRNQRVNMSVSNISSVNTTRTEETQVLLGKKRDSKVDEVLESELRERNNLRNLRKKEIERERRMEISGIRRKNNSKDAERDISERIALGQAQPTSKEHLIDSRLYNQTTGVDSGFKDDDDYDLYDKPLFADRTQASIYKNIKTDSYIDDDSGANVKESQKLMEKISKRANMFEGADINKNANPRSHPVEFEKGESEYGLDEYYKKK